jgi:hypothetical protein
LPISRTFAVFVFAALRSYQAAKRPNCARRSSCGSSIRIPMSTIWYSIPDTVTRPRRSFVVTVFAGASRAPHCPPLLL